MVKYTIYRGASKVVENLKATGTVSEVVMQQDYADVNFTLPEPVTFQVGDSITIHGKKYYLNIPGEYEKVSSREYAYNLKFEAKWYELNRVIFKFPDEDNELTKTEHSIMATADVILSHIITNLDDAGYTGYTVGQCDTTPEHLFSFSNENCMQVLVKLHEQYKLEFWFDDQVINFGLRTLATAYTLSYGKGNGLYNLTRRNAFTTNPFNKLFVKGGTRNLPPTYGRDRLKMTIGHYIEDAALIAQYGVVEHHYVNDDIYPKRYGTVTAIDTGNRLTFIDSSIDFDIKAHILGTPESPVKPVIKFESGLLAGYDLTLVDYDHTTKKITLDVNTSEKLTEIPGDTFYPQVGDKYGIYDILMPSTYIAAAEAELQTAGQEHFDENKVIEKRYRYGLNLDPLHVRRNYIQPTLNKNIRVIDAALGVDEVLRVNSISRSISNSETAVDIYKYNVELTSVVSASYYALTQLEKKEDKIYKDRIETRLGINARQARQYFADFNDLLKTLFDPTGGDLTYIEALAAKFGTDNQNLDFDGVVFSPNYGGNANSVNISSGNLIHYIYQIAEGQFTWLMPSETITGLDPNKLYYVYAKISKTSAVDTDWIVSENKMLYDALTGYYVIHVGTLMKVVNGKRRYYFVKGVTTILGDTITTGRIVSSDGTSFIIDLDNNTLTIGGGGSDNKLTIFTAQPTSYKKGDLWNVAVTQTFDFNYTFVAGESYEAYATSATFAPTHWKNKKEVFIQDSEPSVYTSKAGALWIDTDNGNAIKRNTGAIWEVVESSSAGSVTFTTDPTGLPYKKGDLLIPEADITTPGKVFLANRVYRATGNTGTPSADFTEIETNAGSQTFTAQPNVYLKGDKWEPASDVIAGGVRFIGGETYSAILNSLSFNAAHWRNDRMVYVQDWQPISATAKDNALWVDTSKGNEFKFFVGGKWVAKDQTTGRVFNSSPASYSAGSVLIPAVTFVAGSKTFLASTPYRAAGNTGILSDDFIQVTDYHTGTPTGYAVGALYRPFSTTTISGVTFYADHVYQAITASGAPDVDFIQLPAYSVYISSPVVYSAGDILTPTADFTIGSKTFKAGRIYRATAFTGNIVADFAEVGYGKSTSYVGSTAPAGTDFNINDTWLQTTASGGKLWYWDGSDWVEGVRGADESGAVADYLNDALTDISTEIVGGLNLAGVIAVKNSSGVVKGYMNGSDYSDIIFASGVSNFGQTNETQKGVDRLDGSGFRANGKLSWDENGNVVGNDVVFNNGVFNGTINANSGTIGSLSISSTGLWSTGIYFGTDINGDPRFSIGEAWEDGGDTFIYFKGMEYMMDTGLSVYNDANTVGKTLLTLEAGRKTGFQNSDIAMRVKRGHIYLDSINSLDENSVIKGRVKTVYSVDMAAWVLVLDQTNF